MANHIFTTWVSSTVGRLYIHVPGASSATNKTLPTGVTSDLTRPCFTPYYDRTIINGQFDPGIVVDTSDNLFKLGITAPSTAPVLTNGTGTVTGICSGYYTFQQVVSGVVWCESGPSPVSNEITLAAEGRNWTNIPTTADSRVTHVALYVSVSGADYRYATRVSLGTATLSNETTATLALGSVLVNAAAPPYTTFAENYHARVFYAGDPEFPSRIWFSEIGLPEQVGALNYLEPLGKETVTGIKRLGDDLVVFTYHAIDVISDASGEYIVRRVSSDVGCVSHHSIVNINDRLWFASSRGVYVYDGGLKFIGNEIKEFWKDDILDDPLKYEASWAEHDADEFTYQLNLEGSSAFAYRFYYLPFETVVGGTGALPWVYKLIRNREDTAIGRIAQAGWHYILVTGSSDGIIREENVYTDGTDDSDTYDKALTIQTAHYHMDDVGGDSEEGKAFTRFWTFLQAESDAWRITYYPGDESASSNFSPKYEDVAASAKTSGGSTWVPKTVHWHLAGKPEYPSGRGITLKYTISNPIGIKWRGFGGWYVAGVATRPRIS